ncbi:hypothetical protein Tsubulata_040553, partial [Turnera subulata]
TTLSSPWDSILLHHHRRRRPSPLDMEPSTILAVETILGYTFKSKGLLQEALTHSSFPDPSAPTYERLEFIGDAALALAFSNYAFLAHPALDPGRLSLVRAANTSTEKFARVAVKHGLYCFLRRNSASLDNKVSEFSEAVSHEDDTVVYGGAVKAPKVLADIVEAVAAAIFVDLDYDLQGLWVIIRGLLEPFITLEDLERQPQPVTMLYELCQKQGLQVDIKHWNKGGRNISSVFVEGTFVASASSEQKDFAKLNAAKHALDILSQLIPLDTASFGEIFDGVDDGSVEVAGAKQRLHGLCRKKKWANPHYNTEQESGPSHGKRFVCSVQIPTVHGVLFTKGDEKTRVKDAENSAASAMLYTLQGSKYL